MNPAVSMGKKCQRGVGLSSVFHGWVNCPAGLLLLPYTSTAMISGSVANGRHKTV